MNKLLHSFAADGTADSPDRGPIQGRTASFTVSRTPIDGAGVLFQLSAVLANSKRCCRLNPSP